MKRMVIAAPGPSLISPDLELVRGELLWVVGNAWELAPWADALYHSDLRWWRAYNGELGRYRGRRLTAGHEKSALPPGVEPHQHRTGNWLADAFPYCTGKNSGHGAIALAFLLHQPDHIALLGYDCQHTNGLHHFFGPHRHNLTNPHTFVHWLADFRALQESCKKWGVSVTNCSRESAIDAFPRMTIEEWLARTADDSPAPALSAAGV